MVTDAAKSSGSLRRNRKRPQKVTVVRKKGERRKYVSQHFNSMPLGLKQRKRVDSTLSHDERASKAESETHLPVRKAPNDDLGTIDRNKPLDTELLENLVKADFDTQLPTDSTTDVLSSDSDLTDVPDDIGPDPFLSDEDALPPSVIRSLNAWASQGRKGRRQSSLISRPKSALKKKKPAISPYFPTVRHAHRPQFLTTLPFPPLSHTRFGLMQEKLAHDPFRLLLATIFLNKTPGMRAMPIFYKLMDRYPTPKALAHANVADVTEIIRELGFQNQRAAKCVAFANMWVKCPPENGRRFRKLHYPRKGDGKDVKEDETIDDSDERVAWEISHLPGLGPYSHDSWRMFCRDEIRHQAADWLGTNAVVPGFEPEWKRVLPTDKELRAWMTWMWLKEGWIWNKETGERTRADSELMKLAEGGGIVQEPQGKEHLVVKPLDTTDTTTSSRVEHPAGDFMLNNG